MARICNKIESDFEFFKLRTKMRMLDDLSTIRQWFVDEPEEAHSFKNRGLKKLRNNGIKTT